MDTNKLFKAIQIIVQEEVKKEVAKREKAIRESILKEMKLASNKKPMVKKVEKDPLDVDHLFESTNTNTVTKKSTVQFGGKFSNLLNETAESGEWRSINSMGGSRVFTSNIAQGFGSSVQSGVLETAEGRTVSVEQLQQTEAGAAVVDALTKDYSALMKAIDAKKKGM